MQFRLPFDPAPLLPRVRQTLRREMGDMRPEGWMEPVDQLVKSSISGRTKDDVSWAAYRRLREAFDRWDAVVEAGPVKVLDQISDVTYADEKAGNLVNAMRRIVSWRGELSLDFLADLPTEVAFRKLQNLPGVGPKVAASVMNFSTLRRPVLVADTHVRRVAFRLGLTSSIEKDRAHDELAENIDPAWDGDDLQELHVLMKRHGQSVCVHGQPKCRLCPLAKLCPSNLSDPGKSVH